MSGHGLVMGGGKHGAVNCRCGNASDERHQEARFGAQDTLLFGTAIVLTMLFMPEGFIGIFDRWLSLGDHSARHRESMATLETVP